MIDSSRRVTKYTVHYGALVWCKYKNNWRPGTITSVARTKAEVNLLLKSGKTTTTLVKYDDLIYRKANEQEPPVNAEEINN